MDEPAKKPRIIGNDGTIFRCPMCKTLLATSGTPTFPFCSDRCRLLDLNNWLEGNYTVSRPIDPTDELDDLPVKPRDPQNPVN